MTGRAFLWGWVQESTTQVDRKIETLFNRYRFDRHSFDRHSFDRHKSIDISFTDILSIHIVFIGVFSIDIYSINIVYINTFSFDKCLLKKNHHVGISEIAVRHIPICLDTSQFVLTLKICPDFGICPQHMASQKKICQKFL